METGQRDKDLKAMLKNIRRDCPGQKEPAKGNEEHDVKQYF